MLANDPPYSLRNRGCRWHCLDYIFNNLDKSLSFPYPGNKHSFTIASKSRPLIWLENGVWFGVDDAKKRKKIQDRLAQRARRKLYFFSRLLSISHLATGDRIAQRKSLSRNPSSSNGEDIQPLPRTQPATTSHLPPLIQPNLIEPISLDHGLLPLPQHTIYSATFHNGVILGLACGCSSVSTS